MTNTYNNVAAITGAIAEALENKVAFAKGAYHGFDDSFKDVGVKHGDTINLRVPSTATYRTGATAQPGSFSDTYVPLTITQAGSDFKLTSAELRLNIDDLKKQKLDAMAARIASEIDYAGIGLYNQIPLGVGDGTAQTTIATTLKAGAILTQLAVPPDRRTNCMHPISQSTIVGGNVALFNPAQDISEQYRTGNLGSFAGMAHSMDGQMVTHQGGTYAGTPLMKGTTADGASTIDVDGWTSGQATLNKGDIITIAGVHSVNPITKRSTGRLKQFVVTATTSDSGGEMAALPISPTIHLTGVAQNVDALPLDEAAITPLLATGVASPINIIHHEQAFVMGSADLELIPGGPEVCSRVRIKDLNMSLRVWKYANGNEDSILYRCDVMFGWALYRPEFAIRNHG